ncbi:phosphatase PAP2 family protein [Pedobacter sp. L105]|uniref:phosphatase PAP2 family protein n=1 Tax=Pedobacter sp. L105 TaxID=1641871 RepID=UPI00131E870F|nr:phosphatase PAP2 family protein [Pedobacter sp. L105]
MLNKCFLLSALFLLSVLSSKGQQADTVATGRPKFVAFILPAAAVTYGFVALNNNTLRRFDNYVHKKINQDNHSFHTSADDYLRYVPALAVYGLDLMGIKGRNNFRDKTAILIITAAFTTASVDVLKTSSNRMRPNRLNDYSFPSGHAATAFATAEFLRKEYGEESIWYSIGGYGVASATSVLRLYKNYHWFSDVVAGAGLGILSTKFAYLVYPSVQKMIWGKKKSDIVILPTYQNGGPAFALSGRF